MNISVVYCLPRSTGYFFVVYLQSWRGTAIPIESLNHHFFGVEFGWFGGAQTFRQTFPSHRIRYLSHVLSHGGSPKNHHPFRSMGFSMKSTVLGVSPFQGKPPCVWPISADGGSLLTSRFAGSTWLIIFIKWVCVWDPGVAPNAPFPFGIMIINLWIFRYLMRYHIFSDKATWRILRCWPTFLDVCGAM